MDVDVYIFNFIFGLLSQINGRNWTLAVSRRLPIEGYGVMQLSVVGLCRRLKPL